MTSIKNYIYNHKSRKYLILLLIEHKSVTQWADVFNVHISNHIKFSCSRVYLNDQCSVICFQAIWENQFYYLFGFLFLVFVILASCVSQISIVMIYFQLCAEVCLVIMLKNFTVYICILETMCPGISRVSQSRVLADMCVSQS